MEIDRLEEDISGLTKTLREKEEEKKKAEKNFKDECWDLKREYDKCFLNAFEGYRNSKKSFKEKVLSEISNNSASLKSFKKLKEKGEKIFDDLEKINKFNLINFEGLNKLETASILKNNIIGKDDVDIAEMIKSLNNSDWVKKGMTFYEKNNQICPFCQQPTDDSLKKQLEEYFDETFNRKIKEVKKILRDYQNKVQNIINQLDKLTNSKKDFLNKTDILKEKEIIETKIFNNKDKIQNKIEEPSSIIEIDSIIKNLANINKFIEEANESIKAHNELVENSEKEEKILVSQMWRFIISEIECDYRHYKNKKNGANKAIESISKIIKQKEEEITSLNAQIKELESKIMSIQPTINDINSILSSFGFENFKLKEAEKKGNYKIVRENGENAKGTLSEGEKTFISFLYFYHLLHGSTDEETITKNKVVVFDDPISSLDSNVLFIVSNLIKNIIKEVRNDKGTVKQVFVFTHNVYFHKEVTFISSRENNNNRNDTTFKILRKKEDTSVFSNYNTNPIKTSYELLWQEVKEAKTDPDITIQNTLRRIIENYFKILGNIDEINLINKFEGKEKIICRSLISWINEGSHLVKDDLFVESSIEIQFKYLTVFKKIFEKTGHKEHYNMMMDENV